jgi:hypothetical protein
MLLDKYKHHEFVRYPTKVEKDVEWTRTWKDIVGKLSSFHLLSASLRGRAHY